MNRLFAQARNEHKDWGIPNVEMIFSTIDDQRNVFPAQSNFNHMFDNHLVYVDCVNAASQSSHSSSQSLHSSEEKAPSHRLILRPGYSAVNDTLKNYAEHFDKEFTVDRIPGYEIPPWVWLTYKTYYYDVKEREAKDASTKTTRPICCVCKEETIATSTTCSTPQCANVAHYKCLSSAQKKKAKKVRLCPSCEDDSDASESDAH